MLLCPACRHVRDGALHVNALEAAGGLMRCACGASYPVIDGVPIVLPNTDAWLASEGAEAVRRADLPAETAARIAAGAGGAIARNDALLAVYGASREGPLQSWLRERVGALPGLVLELGAGLGACDRRDVVAVDSNLALLRRHPGVRVCADAADPPFLPAQFDAVVLPNLLDSCADPAIVLAQADGLLKPGGTLIVTCAYAFQDAVTPRERRFGPRDLVDALNGRAAFGGYRVAHRLLEETDGIPWPLRLGPRLVHVHEAQALISQKSP